MRRGRDDLWLKSFIPLISPASNTTRYSKIIQIIIIENQLLFSASLLPLLYTYCKINWNFCGDHNIQTKCEKGTAAAATLDTLEWSH